MFHPSSTARSKGVLGCPTYACPLDVLIIVTGLKLDISPDRLTVMTIYEA